MTLTSEQFYAADVSRWHASVVPELRDCGDTIQSHQQRCLWYVERLVGSPSQSLLDATRWHDQPEVILGDMPYTTKRDHPALSAAWDVAEQRVIAQYDVPQPQGQQQRDMIKLVDRIDAYNTMRLYAPRLTDNDDWTFARWWIMDRAEAMGVYSKVAHIIS